MLSISEVLEGSASERVGLKSVSGGVCWFLCDWHGGAPFNLRRLPPPFMLALLPLNLLEDDSNQKESILPFYSINKSRLF